MTAMREANATIVERAKRHFGEIVEEQLSRIQRLKEANANSTPLNYALERPIVVGFVGGDGIGPYII